MLQMSFTNTAALPASCRAPPAPSAAVLTFTLFNHLIFFPPFYLPLNDQLSMFLIGHVLQTPPLPCERAHSWTVKT